MPNSKIKFIIVKFDRSSQRYAIVSKVGHVIGKKIAESLAEKLQRNNKGDTEYFVWTKGELDKYVDGVRDKLKRLRAFITKKYAYQDLEKIYVHVSPSPLEHVKDSKETMRLSNKHFNYNPEGLWFSCGVEWIELLLAHPDNMVNYNIDYAYSLNLNEKKILSVNNKKEFLEFVRDYHKKTPEGIGNVINSNKMKSKYSGLKICPYRSDVLNPIITETAGGTSAHTLKVSKQMLSKVLGSDVTVEKYNLMTEWYRHWDVASGLVWKADGVSEVKLLAKYDEEKKKWSFE